MGPPDGGWILAQEYKKNNNICGSNLYFCILNEFIFITEFALKIKSKIQQFLKNLDNYLHSNKSFISKIYLFGETLSNKLAQHNSFLMAAGLAFNIFLYFIPLILIGIFIATKLIDAQILDNTIETIVLEFLPPTESTLIFLYELLNEISKIQSGSLTSGIIGIVTLIWLSSLFVAALRSSLDKVMEIESPRHFIFYKIKDIVLTLVFPVIIIVYAIGLMGITVIVSFINSYVTIISDDIISEFSINLFSVLFTFVLFWLIYRYIPSQIIKTKLTLLAAAIGSSLIAIARWIFAFYLSYFSNYSTFYGAYAAIISLAIWVYYLSAIIIISLEISAVFFQKNKKI